MRFCNKSILWTSKIRTLVGYGLLITVSANAIRVPACSASQSLFHCLNSFGDFLSGIAGM
jgi:hypothetical protein